VSDDEAGGGGDEHEEGMEVAAAEIEALSRDGTVL